MIFEEARELADLYQRKSDLRIKIGLGGLTMGDSELFEYLYEKELDEINQLNEDILVKRGEMSIPEVLIARVIQVFFLEDYDPKTDIEDYEGGDSSGDTE